MKPERLLVIGGSAGSLQVILAVLSAVGRGSPMPVLVVLHRNVGFESTLEHLIFARTGISIKEVEEKEPLYKGTVYLCPADYHVLVEADRSFSLDYSERVNFSRPSIDVSFRSAADVYGPGLMALLLSGGNADGVEGMQYVQERGGVTVVQDPATAEVPYMPQHAVTRMSPDHILPTDVLPGFIRNWVYM
ncbi:MAG TPA: chemotaxis protein CheB [Puia sp.]|jgi:two-component system chemotaxis response regulator CheB|nr:chemotaxis protein CheB [Puia sp.]